MAHFEKVFLDTQIGGHEGMFCVTGPGKITKETSPAEVKFYAETLKNTKGLENFCPKLSHTTPPPEEGEKGCVIMEDLCYGFEKPSILDLKIGLTSVGPDACEVKTKKMQKKDQESTTHTLGVRFTGMRIWEKENQNFRKFDKAWGKDIKDHEFSDKLGSFFGKQGAELVESALKWTRELEMWMEENKKLRFISSSILFVYDGEHLDKGLRMSMIDFAHVFPLEHETKDNSYLYGLKTVIRSLEEIQSKLLEREEGDGVVAVDGGADVSIGSGAVISAVAAVLAVVFWLD